LTVQGEKSARPLHETFASAAVITNDDIDNQSLLSIYDVLDRASNVVVDGNRTSFSIRGVDAFSVSGSGEGPLASVYLDGAAVPRLAMASGPLDVFDVTQVEVFRGSQSTIHGRNTLAGAVIINTANPGYDWTGKTRLLLRRESGDTRVGVAIGGPIVDDQLAFRIAAESSRSDGFLKNITRGTHGDRRRSFSVTGKILLEPAFLSNLSMIVTILQDRHKRGAFYGELDAPYSIRDRAVASDIQDLRQVDSTVVTLTSKYELGPTATLTSASNLSHFHFRSIADADRTSLPGQISFIDEPTTTFQHELRLNFSTKRMQGFVGAFYLRQRQAYQFSANQSLSFSSLGVPGMLQGAGVPLAVSEAVTALYGGAVPIQNGLLKPQRTENVAAFGDFTFPLLEGLRLRTGLRYDRETQEGRTSQVVAIDRALPDPTSALPALSPIVSQLNSSLNALVEGANSAAVPTRAVYEAWLPLLGVIYDLGKDAAVSGTVRRGYRAGGNGINQQRGTSFSFGPEFTTSYEVAVRSAWFARRLTVNANFFWTEWKNQQVSVQLTPGSLYDAETVNAGRSRLYGFELEGRAKIQSPLEIYAGAGFTNAKFQNFDVDEGIELTSAAGRRFPRAPRWTASGGASYKKDRGPCVNINLHYRSGYYQSITDQRSKDIPARAIVSAKVGWRGRALSAYLTATNIFNAQKREQFFVDVDGRRRGALGEPRVIGFGLEGHI
jgi:iron complex outermembrane recepter protein